MMKKNILYSLFYALVMLFTSNAFAMCGTSTTWDLFAGQTALVGSVEVTNDMDNLYVTYSIDTVNQPHASFGTLHLWVGSDLLNLPRSGQNNSGAPIQGHFPFNVDTGGVTSYTYTIAFSELSIINATAACGLPLYVVAHAEVNGVMDDAGNLSGETAYAGDHEGDGNRWWFYGIYTVQCECGEPQITSCETAYGKGNYVWTTMRRSNPESLPSLELTHNRWGWAVNMSEPGTVVNPLYAGAGLNRTNKATLVGDVSINWDGSEVTVSYNLYGANMIREAHIYVGDMSPDTIAPGQYGSTAYFGEDGTTSYSETFTVSDTDGDGIWVVAHSVACY